MNEITTFFGHSPQNVHAFSLNSQEEAWEFLEQLQNEDFPVPDDIILGEWANVKIYLKGDKFHSSITPSIFPVFQSLQKEINRAYADCTYGDRLKKLTNEEKEKLEAIIYIQEGSSLTETAIETLNLLNGCLSKMTKRQVYTIALSALLIWGSTTAFKEYLHSKAEIRKLELENQEKKDLLETFLTLSEQETQRMALVADIAQKDEIVRGIFEQSESLQSEKLKAATKGEESNICGIPLNQDQAEELSKTNKEKPEPQRIDGTFQILNLNWDNVGRDNIRYAEIRLKRVSDGATVTALFGNDYLSEESLELIKTAEWDKDGYRLINAQINARVLRGKIIDADLMTVSRPTEEDFRKLIIHNLDN